MFAPLGTYYPADMLFPNFTDAIWHATMEYAVEEAEEKGKTKEQRLIAANFKKQGVNIETIAQCTGLSVEEINGL